MEEQTIRLRFLFILTSGCDGDLPTSHGRQRLEKIVELAHLYPEAVIAIIGGRRVTGMSEAEVYARYLKENHFSVY